MKLRLMHYLMFPLFILLFINCFAGIEKEIRSGYIHNYKSQIEIFDLDDTIVFGIEDLNDIIYSAILGKNEVIGNDLKINIKKNLEQVFYNDYNIRFQKQLNHPLIKNILFYFIDSRLIRGIDDRPSFTLAIDKAKNRIYKFQHYEGEITKLIFDGVKKSDIKDFNKILKDEKIKISTVEQALDVCVLFINIAKHSMLGKVMFNTEKIENEYVDKIKNKFKPPSFAEYKDKYRIKFICDRRGYLFYEWEFEVYKSGRINLIYMKEIEIE